MGGAKTCRRRFCKEGEDESRKSGMEGADGQRLPKHAFFMYHPKTQLYGAWIAQSVRDTWP